MRLGGDRRGVVRRDQDADIRPAGRPIQNLADDVLVEFLDGLDLFAEVTFVAGLVRRFDVQIDEILRRQGLLGRGDLARVIRSQIAGGAVLRGSIGAGPDSSRKSDSACL